MLLLEGFNQTLAENLMIERGKPFIKVHDPTDDAVNAFALQFFFIWVQVILESFKVDIKHDCSMMEGLSTSAFFSSQVQSVCRPTYLFLLE
jgi:hypothetical protein